MRQVSPRTRGPILEVYPEGRFCVYPEDVLRLSGQVYRRSGPPFRPYPRSPRGTLFRMRIFFLFAMLGGLALPGSLALAAQEPMAPAHRAHVPGQLSTALTVSSGDRHVTLSLMELQAMPQTSVTVLNAHSQQQETYSGPLVSEVLAKAGVVLGGAATEHDVLRSYVVATGTDGYFVVFSGAELQGALHKGQFLVAIAKAGQSLKENGAFQVIDPLDVKPARWVRNLSRLTVMPVAAPAP